MILPLVALAFSSIVFLSRGFIVKGSITRMKIFSAETEWNDLQCEFGEDKTREVVHAAPAIFQSHYENCVHWLPGICTYGLSTTEPNQPWFFNVFFLHAPSDTAISIHSTDTTWSRKALDKRLQVIWTARQWTSNPNSRITAKSKIYSPRNPFLFRLSITIFFPDLYFTFRFIVKSNTISSHFFHLHAFWILHCRLPTCQVCLFELPQPWPWHP